MEETVRAANSSLSLHMSAAIYEYRVGILLKSNFPILDFDILTRLDTRNNIDYPHPEIPGVLK